MIGDAKGIGVVVAVEPREVVETEESYADEQQGYAFCNRNMSVQVRGHLSIFLSMRFFSSLAPFGHSLAVNAGSLLQCIFSRWERYVFHFFSRVGKWGFSRQGHYVER